MSVNQRGEVESAMADTVKLTVLGSGSGGNSSVLQYGDSALMIDAGFSGVELQRRLNAAEIENAHLCGLVITHEHDDHVQAARVFCKRNDNLAAYANVLTAARLMQINKAPANLIAFANGTPFAVGPFHIEPFSISHDAVDPVALSIRVAGRKIGIVTDLGYVGKMVPLKLRNSHALVLESNHDDDLLRQSKRPPHLLHRIHGRRGHLSNTRAAELFGQVIGPDTQHLILAHLSEDCNCPTIVERTFQTKLQDLQRTDVSIQVASQTEVCATVCV
jgi:phosphoribosyl 1,2-cyclic phosphodiesterase